ncbi:MAG: hypothetical protein DMD82_06840 [Candidatus Rokuibacteriota bacterium]|nr:MAG: hypothetical protein DMD82_06840 [Candidatus Rokubacteria bacterium]
MRFTITGEWKRNSLLRLIIVSFLLYGAALWVTNALLYFNKMSLSYRSVVEYYLGSEARFLQPRSYQGLLEVTHFHVFAMGIFILTMAHLTLFVPLRPRTKLWLICLSFFAGIADEAAGWLTRFVHPGFAYAKIGAFLLLQGTLAVLLVAVLVVALGGFRNAYTEDL